MYAWILTIFIAVQPMGATEEEKLKHQFDKPFNSYEECLVMAAQAQVTIAEELGDALKMSAAMCTKVTVA